MLNKPAGLGRYRPSQCIGAIKQTIMDNPDPDHVGKSFATRWRSVTSATSTRRLAPPRRGRPAWSMKMSDIVPLIDPLIPFSPFAALARRACR
jgi:hypothetical protein